MDSGGAARTTSRKRVRSHPYAAQHTALRRDLGSAAETGRRPLGDAPGTPVLGHAHVWLPSVPRHPLPPAELPPLEDAPTSGRVELRQWSVPILSLASGDALRVLRELGADTGDVAAGASLRHLAAVAEVAERLVETRRVIPQLVTDDAVDPPQGSAQWRPVLDRGTNAWLREAARALPPVARAHHPVDASAAETGQAVMGDLVTLLCVFTDHIARSRTRGALPAPAGTAPRLREQWLHALTSDDGDCGLRPAQQGTAASLQETLREWFTATHQESGDLRVVFRLVDPDAAREDPDAPERADADAWLVEFWAQSTAEPSLMVRLGDVWHGGSTDWLPATAETSVLRALGRARRCYPRLGDALRSPTPTHLEIDVNDAHTFLTTHARALDEAGFGVLLPKWAGRRKVGLRFNASSRSAPASPSSGLGGAVVDFDFRATIDDQELGRGELAELARLKQPLVKLRGEWTQLDPAKLQAAADFLAGGNGGTVDARDALRMAVSPEVDTGTETLPLTGVDADGELGALLEGTAARTVSPMGRPAGFTAELRPYQQRGAAWLRFLEQFGLGSVLADDMGLGKTVQLLALLAAEREDGAAPAPTLLVCPVSLLGNWQREISRFVPALRVHLHHGQNRPRGAEVTDAASAADVVLTSYGLATRDVEELSAVGWRRVVCDEAQAIKNPHARQARAIRSIPAPSRIALTGTPVENHLGELWSVMEFTNPGLLGPQKTFRHNIAAAVESAAASGHTSEAAEEATQRLHRVTRPFVLRRLKTDDSIVDELPDKQEMKAWCGLTREQASLYQATVDDMTKLVDEASGIQRRGLVLATMTKLKQICNHPAHLLGDGSRLDGRSRKLEMLCELLSGMVAEGDKALCFTQYTDFGDRLAPYLTARLGVEVLWLHGQTPRSAREDMVRRFHESGRPMVFLLSLKAGGTGLNLTAANQVIHVDRWWNPAVEDQATDRAFRIGQQRNVQVRKMICAGTLEERVDAMIEGKRNLAEAVVGSGEEWLGELSTDELRDVIRLAPEAVEG
ncbi:SNF2-related protein [Haloactinospora alba]